MKSPRSKDTEAKYRLFKEQKLQAGEDLTAFKFDDEIVVREFKNWVIIENRFPYDNMTSVNHMLVPRRAFEDYYKANEAEREEYHEIIRTLAKEDYYDALVENFPRSRSVSRHNHVHLVRWKYTTDSGKNKSDVGPSS